MNEFFAAVVPENVPVGISVINITATDPDEGLGGEVKYEFLDEGEANGKSLFILFNYLSTNCPNNAYSWSYVNVYFFTFFLNSCASLRLKCAMSFTVKENMVSKTTPNLRNTSIEYVILKRAQPVRPVPSIATYAGWDSGHLSLPLSWITLSPVK